MNTLKSGFLAVMAAGSLLPGLGGVVAAQPPARGGTDAIPGRPPVVDGYYCPDESGGQVWVAYGVQASGVYCSSKALPAYAPPAFPNSMPDDPDQGSQ